MLDQIIREKKRELGVLKNQIPLSEIKKAMKRNHHLPISLAKKLSTNRNRPHFICEMKKASPSEGLLRKHFDPDQILGEFEKGGACGISILTDTAYFQGGNDVMLQVRRLTKLPLLRKDFIFDDYQVYETKWIGADVILLMVSILEKKRLKELLSLAHRLGMECLVEIHDEAEIKTAAQVGAQIIGINNRNLKTLGVDSHHADRLISKIPQDILKVVESGIYSNKDIRHYENRGVDGFLIGTALMKAADIGKKIKELRSKNDQS